MTNFAKVFERITETWLNPTHWFGKDLLKECKINSKQNNPIELFKAVKEYNLNYQEYIYGMSIVLDSISTMMPTKYKEHESLLDYTKRFKVAKDVMEMYIRGPIMLTKYKE